MARIVFVRDFEPKKAEWMGEKTIQSLIHQAKIPPEEVAWVTMFPQGSWGQKNYRQLYTDKQFQTKSDTYELILEDLFQEIRSHSPNVTILLGEEALRGIGGKLNLGNWRGSIIGTPVGKAVPTYHPRQIAKQYTFLPIVSIDILKAFQESTDPEINLPSPELTLSPSFCDVQRWVEQALDEGVFLSFDIETIAHHIDCIGLSWKEEEGICIPFCDTNGNPYWTYGDEQRIWQFLDRLLTGDTFKLIAQNATYDITYLERYGIKIQNLWMDTMNASHAVYPEFPKGLDFLTSIYTRHPYYKDKIGISRWEYNALDAVITLEVAFEIEKRLRDFGTHDFYHGFVNKLIFPYMEVQNGGMAIDLAKKEEAVSELEKNLTQLLSQIEKEVGQPLNPQSPKQLQTYFYETKGYEAYLNRKTGRPSCDDEALRRLYRKYEDPVIPFIREYRDKAKLKGTLATPVDCDGRIRTSYILSGTETGRLASRTHVFGSGTNLQNIPRKGIAKEIFIAAEGNTLIGADLSQAEARVVAFLSRDPGLIKLFGDRGRDVHSENAALIFGGKPEDYPETEERQIAKTTTHAANYDISYKSYALTLGIPEKEGKRILDTYHNLYPGIRRWHRETIETLERNNRILVTPWGRKRRFFGRWGDSLFKEAFAYIPQSTVADLINKGLLRLYSALKTKFAKREKAWIRLQVHDALYVECEESVQEEVLNLVIWAMEIPITIGEKTLVIPAEAHVGKTWNDV